jgi:hypothetical protein
MNVDGRVGFWRTGVDELEGLRESCIPACTPWNCCWRLLFWRSSRMRCFVALSLASHDERQ